MRPTSRLIGQDQRRALVLLGGNVPHGPDGLRRRMRLRSWRRNVVEAGLLKLTAKLRLLFCVPYTFNVASLSCGCRLGELLATLCPKKG